MKNIVYVIILSLLAPVIFSSEKGNIQIYCESGVKVFLNGKYKGKSREKLNGYVLKNLKFESYEIELEKTGKKEVQTVLLNDTLVIVYSIMFTRSDDKDKIPKKIDKRLYTGAWSEY